MMYINGKNLDLSQQNLTEIPVEIWQLTPKVLLAQLTTLDLHLNTLTQLPVEIWQLIQLTELNLSYNQLAQIPVEIVNIPLDDPPAPEGLM